MFASTKQGTDNAADGSTRRTSRGRVLIGGAAIVVAAIGVPSAMATASTTAKVYTACVNNVSGAMRQVSASTTCNSGEHRISWNNIGPAGATGATGATGPAGATGATGPA
ncbi:MAG TPA: hypothetical protein VIJ23_04785, partial [Mycobacterium sp.]